MYELQLHYIIYVIVSPTGGPNFRRIMNSSLGTQKIYI